MSSTETTSTPPPWFDMWTNPARVTSRTYNSEHIACMRQHARDNPAMRDTMIKYPPHCVIAFTADGKHVHGIVTGACMIDLDKLAKGKPRRTISLRYVPSPIHVAGVTSEDERDHAFVMPDGVKVLGYAPGYTPETMRALVAPVGLA
jgi:hypothetical protein